MRKNIFIAGHRGMVGSAIFRLLSKDENNNLIVKDRKELDLTVQAEVQEFFNARKIDEVYLAAAMVGGIGANNNYPADFIYRNLMIEANVINSSFLSGVKKLMFLGSSCIYPKLAEQPMREDSLLTGKLEPTNEPYAIAKIAGIKLCESYNRQHGGSFGIDYRSVMPTNLYGPGDNYHPINSHVLPALIRRFHFAKINNEANVVIWGTGTPRREFLYVDDMASASVHVMNLSKETYDKNTEPMQSHLNVGSGTDISILDLAHLVKDVVKFNGLITTDPTKPDGAPRKLMDSSRINSLGWHASVPLRIGIEKSYEEFLSSAPRE